MTRYRHETHYRYETRTRLVTRYRTETRYRTVTDEIFDRKWGVNVVVTFPAGSQLQGSETETILAELAGTEQNPDANVSVSSSIFQYAVVSKNKQGGTIYVELAMRPKYSAGELGEQTIRDIKVVAVSRRQHQLQFVDTGLVGRSRTQYLIEIRDARNGDKLFEKTLSSGFGGSKQTVDLPEAVSPELDLQIRMRVVREGDSIEGGRVEFTKAASHEGRLDPGPYVDVTAVGGFKITGTERLAQLVFADTSPEHQDVTTVYEITLRRDVSYRDVVGQGSFNRSALRAQGNGTYVIALNGFPGISTGTLDKHFNAGDGIVVEMTVVRRSDHFGPVSPVRFNKEAQLKVNR